jgi:hypothetical protein
MTVARCVQGVYGCYGKIPLKEGVHRDFQWEQIRSSGYLVQSQGIDESAHIILEIQLLDVYKGRISVGVRTRKFTLPTHLAL